MSYLNGQVNTTKETLDLLHSEANVTSSELDTLTDEANQLELRVQDLIQQVYNIKNANIQGETPQFPMLEGNIYAPSSDRNLMIVMSV